MATKQIPVMLFDMASLEVVSNSEGFHLKTPTGSVLSTVGNEEVKNYTRFDTIFRCYDGALNNIWIHEDRMCIIGLYNPVTGEVSIGGVPSTKVYKSFEPLHIEHYGLLGSVSEDSIVTINGQVLDLVQDVESFIMSVRKSLNASL